MTRSVTHSGSGDRNVTHKRTRSPNGQRRVPLNVRVRRQARDAVDQRAAVEGVDRSEMTRRALAYALQHMPRGWVP